MNEKVEYFTNRLVAIRNRIVADASAKLERGEMTIEEKENGIKHLDAYVISFVDRFVLEEGFNPLEAIQLMQGLVIASKQDDDEPVAEDARENV